MDLAAALPGPLGHGNPAFLEFPAYPPKPLSHEDAGNSKDDPLVLPGTGLAINDVERNACENQRCSVWMALRQTAVNAESS